MTRITTAAALLVMIVASARADTAVAALRARASVDHDHVFVGEPFTLTIVVNGTQRAEAPQIGRLDGFEARYLGSTTQLQNVGGSVTTSISYRFTLTGAQPGRYQLGPFRVEAEGNLLTTQPLEVTVSARSNSPEPTGGGDSLRLLVLPEKTRAYVGERIALTVELYVGNVSVDNLHFPTLAADGFAMDSFPQPTQQERMIRDRRWQVLRFRSTLTPLKAGTLVLGPGALELEVLETRRRSRGSLFEDLFGTVERKPTTVRAEAIEIEVQPLPAGGRPADFSGAVGQFDLVVQAAPTDVAVGDPITVRIEVRGVGNLEGIAPPAVPAGPKFRAYDPVVTGDTKGPGRLMVEQVLIPRDEVVDRIPTVQFSYFEPESGSYRTIARGPIPLRVAPAPAPVVPGVIGLVREAEEREQERLGRDIVYIKDRAGELRPPGAASYRQPWFLGMQAVAPLVFVAAWLVSRRRRVLAADPRLARFSSAGRRAKSDLASLSRDAAGGSYDAVTSVLSRYFADKLVLPPGAIERAAVLDRLARVDAPDQVCEDVMRFFDLAERARYARADSGDGSDKALSLARSIVKGLERDRGIARRIGLTAVVLAALTTAALAANGRDPHTIFYEGNAAYKNGDYDTAILEYQRLLSAGFESGALHFNLGNAYFKRQRYGRAILAYRRAERLLPRDADVDTNLSFALEEAKVTASSAPLWQRIAFAPALHLSMAELAYLWSGSWWLAWAIAFARLFIPSRPGFSRASWVAIAAVAIVSAAIGYRFYADDVRRSAVVVADGSTIVRFEPSPSGKAHFEAAEGTSLEVRSRRGEWLQVRRDDGLRGWAPAADVAPL